jgi:PAS domain S-box-containing protein
MITNEESSLPVFPTSHAGECAALLTWETLFDAFEDGICAQSLDSRIVCANRAFADIIGAPLEQIVGRSCAEVFGCANEIGAVVVRLGEFDRDNEGREVVIEVEDNGRGIPEEDLSRIFSPFFSTNPNGAGLGLPAVRRIARAHGGRVEAASTPGRGSTFTIRLPREYMALEEK